MAERKPRHLVAKTLKSGKALYYWQPPKKLREAGFFTRRLNDNFDIAINEARTLNNELDHWRRGDVEESSLRSGTLSSVIAAYKKDPAFTEKKPSTQRAYLQCLERIERWGGDQMVTSISRVAILDFHRTLYSSVPAFANSICRSLRIVLGYAYDTGLIDFNPAQKLKMKSRPPRQVVWQPDDIPAFCEAAKDTGYPSMALAVLIGIWTAQREGDILKIAWHQFDGETITLRQRKTNRWVNVKLAPELKQALNKAPKKSTQIIISEATGRPYLPDHFRHLFRDIANKAGLRDLQFRDLRRTSIVWMAEAGVPTPQITAVSGHEDAYCNQILEVYMPRNAEMAEQAINKLIAHKKKKAKKKTRGNK